MQNMYRDPRSSREAMCRVRQAVERERYRGAEERGSVIPWSYLLTVHLLIGFSLQGTGFAGGGLAETSKTGVAFQG